MSEPRDPPANGAADGNEHDAWLREALRHAPDAQAAPPANVSHAILAEARSQARTTQGAKPHTHSAANPLLSFWSWLARPPVAAGFASVMAATLVGMMWWDRPMDEAMPKSPPLQRSAPPAAATVAAPVTAPVTVPATAPVAAPVTATVTAPVNAPVDAPEALPPAAPVSPMQAAPARESSARRPEPLKKEVARESARAKSTASPTETQRAEAPPAEAPRAETAKTESPSAFPASPVMRQLARPAPAVEAETRAAALQDALAERAAQPAAKDRAESNGYAAAPPAAPGAGRADTASGMFAAKAAAPRMRPLAPLLASLRDDAALWQRAGSARRVDADGALVRWLAELEAASAGLWVTTNAARARAAPLPGATALVLQREGATIATMRIEGDAYVLESSLDGTVRAWRAELPAAVGERLRTRLPP